MQITIKNRLGHVIHKGEYPSLRAACEASRAELFGADLFGADLTDADLTDADLADADLTDAELDRADLTDAYLCRADLTDAYLFGANMAGANLTRAYLTRADLTDAKITTAQLLSADLSAIKADVLTILSSLPSEAPFLRAALVEGRVNGSTYEGPCACLIGTLANAKGCAYYELGVTPDPRRPAERWFLAIRKGDKPDAEAAKAGPAVAHITLGWVDEFLASLK